MSGLYRILQYNPVLCSLTHMGVTVLQGILPWGDFFPFGICVFESGSAAQLKNTLTKMNTSAVVLLRSVTRSEAVRLTSRSPNSSLPLHRHFLFKTGTGTTPFFGAAAPGYTMATGTVYSTPARPLPRNSLSRGAFKFKKSPKHCSWKCTALIAVGIAVVLSIILCYCIGKASITLDTLWSLIDLVRSRKRIFTGCSAKKISYNTNNTIKSALKGKFIERVILLMYLFQPSYMKVFEVDHENVWLDLHSDVWGFI